LINRATEIISEGYGSLGGGVDDLLDRAQHSIFEITEDRVRPSFYPLKEIIKSSFKTIEKLYEKKQLITGVPTGFSKLDELTSGLQSADLVILAGRPSMGKTALALNIAQHAAISGSIPTAIFSLEMAKEQLALRMLCSEAKVDAHRIRGGYLSESDWPRLTRAAGLLSEAPIFIDDTAALTSLEMRAKTRRLKAEKNLGLVIVDYLQLMRGRADSERREQEISDISRSLKGLAKELNVPVIALSQLNRRVEERGDKRPQLADLRESGAIEQDADVIIFLYRDEVYNKSEDNPNKGKAEIIIGKQRNGPTDKFELAFLDKFTCFENLTYLREGG
jgi:replicative DNA helicase